MNLADRFDIANTLFPPLGEEFGYCDYCEMTHELLDFGANFGGNRTLICSDQLSDVTCAMIDTEDYGALDSEDVEI